MSAVELGVALGLLGVLAAVALPFCSRAREAAVRPMCQNNLKQLGVVMKMYSSEHKGYFPPLSPISDNWMMDMAAIYPEYVTDLQILVCESSPFDVPGVFESVLTRDRMHPDCMSSLFYVYTGFGLFCDEQAAGFFAQYGDRREELLQASALDLVVPVWPDSNRIQTPGQAGMPVMWDRMSPYEEEWAHEPGGSNVLHMDGHVEFVRYSPYNNSNHFPVTRLSVETFGSVLPRKPGHCL